jgi:hypothetical protein
MRLPHYLVCPPSGMWQFRQRMPSELQSLLGPKCFKRSLRTRDVLTAPRLALDVAERCAQIIRQARGLHVSNSRGRTDGILEESFSNYRLIRRPDGAVEIEAGGNAGYERAMEAVAALAPLSAELVQRLLAEAQARPQGSPTSEHDPPIGKVVAQWLADILVRWSAETNGLDCASIHFRQTCEKRRNIEPSLVFGNACLRGVRATAIPNLCPVHLKEVCRAGARAPWV